MAKFVICVLAGFILAQCAAQETFVTIKNGTMRGKLAETANGGGKMYVYTGIPYGKAPMGELRFKNPQPTEGWTEDIFNATEKCTACPQYQTASNPGEDCLQLNVFTKRKGAETPEASKSAKAEGDLLPVMVFFFGGGFALGDNSYYTGTKLLAKDAVLVVPNYRVGVLGFLSTGDEVSPGNYGLKDQNLALRWVQENIEAFGGDPNRVTIFGESAGGASALYHLISPLSRGLFHGVIAQSGTPISIWARHRNPLQAAQQFGTVVNCTSRNSAELVSCLREKPAEEISIAVFNNLVGVLSRMEMELPSSTPVIEPNLPGAFITEDPYKLLTQGDLPDVPVILGGCLNEGSFVLGGFYFLSLANSTRIEDPFYIHEDLIPDLLSTYQITDAAVAETIALGFMPGSRRDNFTEIQPNLNDMLSVFFNKAAILRTADVLSRRLSNVYLYSFEQPSRNTMWTLLWQFVVPIFGGQKPPVDGGIMHADDLMYMFNFPFIPTPTDRTFTKIYNEIWTNFATTGNPTPATNEEYANWPRYTVQNQEYYRLRLDSSVGKDYASTFRAPYNQPEASV
ncbi:unnamed protein product [Allacma fusca]|uniref:Carboxylic ester hydrolase n=1 Tax=Allacma fusca TaxID=39272 RepID=A0A8J2PYC9_9HEXA|nr:unnamed protein product [Allacma fusca]